MAAVPTVGDVRDWCGISPTSLTDDQVQGVLDAELANQARLCRLVSEGTPPDDFPASLRQAIFRRCGREFSGKQVPLGVIGDPSSEYGSQRLLTFDAEVERLEGPYRIVVFA